MTTGNGRIRGAGESPGLAEPLISSLVQRKKHVI
jgi:hypothetical protein